jgi:hypothetical protein
VGERCEHLRVLIWGREVGVALGIILVSELVDATTGRWTYRWGFPKVVGVLIEEAAGSLLDGVRVGPLVVGPPETVR